MPGGDGGASFQPTRGGLLAGPHSTRKGLIGPRPSADGDGVGLRDRAVYFRRRRGRAPRRRHRSARGRAARRSRKSAAAITHDVGARHRRRTTPGSRATQWLRPSAATVVSAHAIPAVTITSNGEPAIAGDAVERVHAPRVGSSPPRRRRRRMRQCAAGRRRRTRPPTRGRGVLVVGEAVYASRASRGTRSTGRRGRAAVEPRPRHQHRAQEDPRAGRTRAGTEAAARGDPAHLDAHLVGGRHAEGEPADAGRRYAAAVAVGGAPEAKASPPRRRHLVVVLPHQRAPSDRARLRLRHVAAATPPPPQFVGARAPRHRPCASGRRSARACRGSRTHACSPAHLGRATSASKAPSARARTHTSAGAPVVNERDKLGTRSNGRRGRSAQRRRRSAGSPAMRARRLPAQTRARRRVG